MKMVLLSIFGSAGYTKQTGRYMYTQRVTFKCYKQGLSNPLAMDEMSVGPVNGFPIPAKHTLLAQLLKYGLPIPQMGTNIIQTSHTRMNPALAISEVDVELELETRGFEHREQILAQIVAQGFEIVTYY